MPVPTCLMRQGSSLQRHPHLPFVPSNLERASGRPQTGGETVLYRHEKTFFNPTVLACVVNSDTDAGELDKKLKIYNAFQYERVGFNLRPELIVLKDAGTGADAFGALAEKIAKESEFNLVLMTEDMDVMKAGIATAGFKRPLLYAATAANVDDMGALAKENDLPLAVKADSIEALMPPDGKTHRHGYQGSGHRLRFQRN